MSDFELLSVGDATIDVFMRPTQSESLCQLDDKDCLICFTYGDKIPVRNVEFCAGGNASNNVVGVTRLGIKAGIVLTLGDDLVGNLIMEKLRAEGVDLTYVVQQPSTNSNFSSIIDYGGERTIFTYHAPRSYEFPVQLPAIPWMYLTSMGESFRPFYKHVIEWLGKNPNVKLVFNPGSWQLKAGLKDGIAEVLARTELVYVNREEAEEITNFGKSQGKEKELLQALSKLGPKTCIITDGSNGSFASDGQRFLKAGVLPVDAYQRTGAGDAFGSGCLAAIIKGKDLSEALIWGTVNSASVIGYTGAQKGLLKMEELSEWLERIKTSGVQVQEF
jgi:ribokinase